MSFTTIPVLADDGTCELHADMTGGSVRVTWLRYGPDPEDPDGEERRYMYAPRADVRAWCEAVLAMLREAGAR